MMLTTKKLVRNDANRTLEATSDVEAPGALSGLPPHSFMMHHRNVVAYSRGPSSSRIPDTLQAVFLASNRGNEVHTPPPNGVAMKDFGQREPRRRRRGWFISLLTSGHHHAQHEHNDNNATDENHNSLGDRRRLRQRQRGRLLGGGRRELVPGPTAPKDGLHQPHVGFPTMEEAEIDVHIKNYTSSSRQHPPTNMIPRFSGGRNLLASKSNNSNTTKPIGPYPKHHIPYHRLSVRNLSVSAFFGTISTTAKGAVVGDDDPKTKKELVRSTPNDDTPKKAEEAVGADGPGPIPETIVLSSANAIDSDDDNDDDYTFSCTEFVATEVDPALVAQEHLRALTRAHGLLGDVSPQKFLDSMIRSRGYSTVRYQTLQSAYYNEPTELQQRSYHVHLVQLLRDGKEWDFNEIMGSGISPNPCNQFGESLLHMVCRRGDSRFLFIMLFHGAILQVADDYGRTPLHDACWAAKPSFAVVDAILRQDPRMLYMTDSRGALPLSYIRKDLWGTWIHWLQSKLDQYWSVRDCDVLGEESPPPLSQLPPHSRPVPNPKSALSLELAAMVAAGRLEPAEAHLIKNEGGVDATASESDSSDSDHSYSSMESGGSLSDDDHNSFHTDLVEESSESDDVSEVSSVMDCCDPTKSIVGRAGDYRNPETVLDHNSTTTNQMVFSLTS